MRVNYFDTDVAERYDDPDDPMFSAEVLGPTVDLLAELAGDRPALELAVGTGRVAIPLAQRGVHVHGIELSEAMVAQLPTGRPSTGARSRSARCGRASST